MQGDLLQRWNRKTITGVKNTSTLQIKESLKEGEEEEEERIMCSSLNDS